MRPRLFYHWKSFWLGLSVLVFVGWAWAVSIDSARGVVWNRKGVAVFALAWDGTIGLGKDNGRGRNPGFDYWSLADRPLLPEAVFPNVARDPKSGLVQFQVPFVLVLNFLIVPWGVWLYCQRKREQSKQPTA